MGVRSFDTRSEYFLAVLAKDTVRDLAEWLQSQGQESESMDVDLDIPILKRTNEERAELQ
jgi:hypothetical protein